MSYDQETESRMDEILESQKIEEIMRQSRPQVAVIGVVGAGCNIVCGSRKRKVEWLEQSSLPQTPMQLI
jgi:acetolactate synthase small subunit